MAIPHFFSVERQGYTKISELFADVMKDMVENGFSLVNSSNLYPLRSIKPTLVSSTATSLKPGNVLYITDGIRPSSPRGIPRPIPYVVVDKVISNGIATANTQASGTIFSMTDVIGGYDFPLWDTEPTGPIQTYWRSNATAPSGVTITISNVEMTRDTLGAVIDAPTNFNFTMEASGIMDPLNGTVDPNSSVGAPLAEADRQPWRIHFDIVDEQKVNGSVATKLQMSYDPEYGRVRISQITDDDGEILDNVGAIGGVQPRGVFSDTDLNQGFYNRKTRVADSPQTFPLSYLLTITDRGFFLGIWEGSWSTVRAAVSTRSNYFNWVLVQRPVDRITGRTLTKGKAPVFHINGVNYKYYKSVVREADILHPTSGPSSSPGTGNIQINGDRSAKPTDWYITALADGVTGEIANFLDQDIWQEGVTIYSSLGIPISTLKAFHSNGAMATSTKAFLSTRPTVGGTMEWSYTPPNILALRVLADSHSPDNHAIFNGIEQVVLTEDKTYLLSFPHNLTTPRFRYTEELDMVGATSSDVVMAGQDIQFTTYGEWGPRTYRAMPANGALNTGFRVAALVAPQGPRWITPAGNFQNVSPGDEINIELQAAKIPDPLGTPPAEQRGEITMEIIRGQLPTGLELTFTDPGYSITGTVETMDITATTEIKVTIAAKNALSDGDGGYALRDFWFTYIPI